MVALLGASASLSVTAGAANKPPAAEEFEVAPRSARGEVPESTPERAPAAIEKEPDYERRYLGIVLTGLSYTGNGGGVRLGTEPFGLLATATAQSLFLWAVSETGRERGDYSGEFKFLNNGQINLDLYGAFGRRNARFRIGGSAGFRHNTLLQNGFAAGAYGIFNIRPDIAVQVQIGLGYYPDGNTEVIRTINRCEDQATDPVAPCGLVPLFDSGFQPGFSLGLLLFP
jgi:hypothetical protein